MTKTQLLVKKLYKNENNEPFLLSAGQDKIFNCVFKRVPKRVNIITYSQYGKSETISMAVLTRINTYAEKWAIIAPTDKKARIIMSAAIGHIFDNSFIKNNFEIGKDENIDRIRRERSKTRLTFRVGDRIGEVQVFSAEAHKHSEFSKALMGFGSPNVIEDEAALIPDPAHQTIIRMLGGHKDNFLVKIGNPFYRNHFYKSSLSPRYSQVLIDYKVGIAEGRTSEDFIAECQEEMSEQMFNVMYGCKFPADDVIDGEGYQGLFTNEIVKSAMGRTPDTNGKKILGVDIGQGGAESVIAVRTPRHISIKLHDRNPDLMATTGNIVRVMKEEGILPRNVFVDDTGVGGGVVARLKEMGQYVQGIRVGETAEDGKFFNKRAEIYFRLLDFLKNGGSLENNENIAEQLSEIKFRVNSSGKLQIEPKEHMRYRGIHSPDLADAMSLCFVRKVIPHDNSSLQVVYSKITGMPIEPDDDESPFLKMLPTPFKDIPLRPRREVDDE